MRLPGIIDMHYFKAPREQFPCSPDGDRVGGSLEKDRVGVEGGDAEEDREKVRNLFLFLISQKDREEKTPRNSVNSLFLYLQIHLQ